MTDEDVLDGKEVQGLDVQTGHKVQLMHSQHGYPDQGGLCDQHATAGGICG